MKDKRVNISDWIIYIGMICIFVVFTIICSALGKQFLTLNNVMNIINQASINAVVAIGASLVILTGGIDLSVGSVVGFVGIFLALRLQEGMPIPVAIILCLVLGAAVGLFNGILISYGKVPAFIVTLGSMQAVRGLAQIINGGQAVSGFPLEIGAVMKTKLFGVIPIGVLYVIVFYAVMILILSYTKFGRRIYALGGNEHAARLSGIKVKKLEVAVYVLCGIFAAFAGVMLLSRLLYADPSAGNSYEMNAIAASVIGGISMSGGKGRLANTVAGAIILATLTNGLQIMNVATYYQTVITGDVVDLVAEQHANWETDQGYTAIQNIIQANKDLQVIYCENDLMGIGAYQAVDEAGLTDQIKIFSYDGVTEGLQYVVDGKFVSTCAQQPIKMGKLGVANMAKIFAGKDAESYIDTGCELITSENAKQTLEETKKYTAEISPSK